MLVEGIVIGVAVLAWKKASEKGNFTPERQECYHAALENLTDVPKLKKLADEFDKQGLYVQATMLRKRAELRGASEVLKAQRKAAYEKGMASTKVEGILALAKEFEKITATGAAKRLREHAAEVLENQKKAAETPVVVEEKKEESTTNGHIEPSKTDIVVEAETKEENANGQTQA